jgi:hypothetical protein
VIRKASRGYYKEHQMLSIYTYLEAASVIPFPREQVKSICSREKEHDLSQGRNTPFIPRDGRGIFIPRDATGVKVPRE